MSWQPLDQVYLNASARKAVSKLPRQRVIGEDVALYTKKGNDYELLAKQTKQYRL